MVNRVMVESCHPYTCKAATGATAGGVQATFHLLGRGSYGTKSVPNCTTPHCEEREEEEDVPSLPVHLDRFILKYEALYYKCSLSIPSFLNP